MSTITPNMNLIAPTPAETAGPEWAEDIVADLSAIDSHDHSAGKGVPITPDGLDINADLSMDGNNLVDPRTIRFDAQSAPLAALYDLGCIYVVNADLYYNDGAGNQVRITQGGSVSGSAGTITGLPSGTASASFAGGTFTFESATNTPATMAVGPLVIGRAAAASKTVTITPNAAQAANYGISTPAALPAATNYTTLDASGNLSFNASGVTGTGAVVQATSPTIATPTISTPTITGGSMTGASVVDATLLTAGNGTGGAPSISFASTPDLGMYRVGALSLGLTVGGSLRSEFTSGGQKLYGQFQSENGDVVHPTYSFADEPSNGMYKPASNIVAISTGGAERLRISDGGLNIEGGGYFKVKVITIGTSSLAAGILSTAHGLTSTSIRSLSGVLVDTVAGTVIAPGSAGVPVNFTASSTTVSATWSGATTNSKTFYVTINYV